MYKILFFDLDGTLLNDKKEVLEENIEAIKRAQENGIQVAICSGRQNNTIKRFKELAGTGRYAISVNGAEIYDFERKELLFKSEIDKEFCKEISNYALENGFFLRIDTQYARYINDMRYLVKEELELDKDINKFVEENSILQISIAAMPDDVDRITETIKDSPIVKVENRYKFIQNNADSFQNVEIENKDKFYMINIINKSASKGNGILGLCKFLKIKPEEVVAFGDDYNDISMMKAVGYGLAMGNSIDAVKQVAKEVIGDNNEPSIARAIDKIIEMNSKGISLL